MTGKKAWSLRVRLSLFFAVLLFAAWVVAAVCSWWESREHINEFFDTQQMLFAKRLAAARYAPVVSHLPETREMFTSRRGDDGEQDDDVLAFAVFRQDGTLLLSDGEAGRKFIFSPRAEGFVNAKVDGDTWRIVWLASLDKRVIVAVGQELEYREDMVLELLGEQMLPWLFLLPVLLVGLIWMLGRELAPLRSVARDLARRAPNDFSPIGTPVQSEVLPLVGSLNSLFGRIKTMLQRERVFIANAAHELRTPLAGLSIQAQVAQSAKLPEARLHALAQLRKGIDRTTRLVDQLLMLSRLESLEGGEEAASAANHCPLRLDILVHEVLEEFSLQAQAKGLGISVRGFDGEPVIHGQGDLFRILLGNLLGNAVKYAPQNGDVAVAFTKGALRITNSSGEIAPADAAKLGERFFRPAGQAEPGSGLGLSIAKRIAELHGMDVHITVTPGRFSVSIATR